jgi:hypothetical protein
MADNLTETEEILSRAPIEFIAGDQPNHGFGRLIYLHHPLIVFVLGHGTPQQRAIESFDRSVS